MTQEERRIFMIKFLLHEQNLHYKIPSVVSDQKILLRALINTRSPQKITDEFLKIQDEYLQNENSNIIDVDDLLEVDNKIIIWQGDITTLKCDAIVNAANSSMTGCYVPNHRCIDNSIHFHAGIQLRLACAELMENQGHLEPTGKAKMTLAYNLPSKYVIHTVGPIITDSITLEAENLLASCYQSCLELASANNLESIAFCCISTGEFRFPNQRTAEIAVKTVKAFLKKDQKLKRVIFNVFKEQDRTIYENLFPKN